MLAAAAQPAAKGFFVSCPSKSPLQVICCLCPIQFKVQCRQLIQVAAIPFYLVLLRMQGNVKRLLGISERSTFCFRASVMWLAERGKVNSDVPESIRAPPQSKAGGNMHAPGKGCLWFRGGCRMACTDWSCQCHPGPPGGRTD